MNSLPKHLIKNTFASYRLNRTWTKWKKRARK